MHETPAGNNCEPLERQHLLPEHGMVSPNTMAWKQRVASGPVFVLEFVARSCQGPTALRVIGLVIKSGAVVVVDVVELKIFVAEGRLPSSLVNSINIRAVQ